MRWTEYEKVTATIYALELELIQKKKYQLKLIF